MPAFVRRLMFRRAALAFTAGVAITPGVFAEAPPSGDLLEQARRMQQVATLQVEADTRLALKEAERLAAADPAKAAEKLKQLLTTLEADRQLTAERRETLLRVVKDRIRVAESAAGDAALQAAEAKARAVADAALKTEDARKQAEAAQVKGGIETVAALRKEGKYAEAAQQAKDLLAKHPTNLAVQVLNGVSTAADNLRVAREIEQERAASGVAAIRDVDRAAVLPRGDIEFPKDWKERSERRLKGQRLSEEELKLLQALNTVIKPEFKSTRLQDVVDYLSTISGRAILLDKGALDENQLSYDTPVTFAPKTAVAMRTVLRSALGQVGLTYVVRDHVIQVTSVARARETMITKSYYVGDIVAATGTFGGAAQWGLALDQAQLAQNVAGVVEMIQSSIDPMSWQGKGGYGTIGFNIPTMSLVIRQSAEVHAMIRGGLYK